MVERYAVDWTSWQAFQLTAARRGFKPNEWLASHVAVGIQQGWTAQEVLELLFGDETLAQAVAESIQRADGRDEEIARFEEAQGRFHGHRVIVEKMNSPHKIEPRLGLVSFGGASLLDAPSVYAFLFCATGLRGFCRGALGDLLTQSQPNTPREPALRYDGAGGLFFSSEAL